MTVLIVHKTQRFQATVVTVFWNFKTPRRYQTLNWPMPSNRCTRSGGMCLTT